MLEKSLLQCCIADDRSHIKSQALNTRLCKSYGTPPVCHTKSLFLDKNKPEFMKTIFILSVSQSAQLLFYNKT
jgi:hypothetical protein